MAPAEVIGIKRFRVGRPVGPLWWRPKGRDPVYAFSVELEPTDLGESIQTEVQVVLTRLSRLVLCGEVGRNETAAGEDRAIKRLWYWVMRQVPNLVDRLTREQIIELRLNDPEPERLAKISPEKVGYDPARWFEVQARGASTQQVFISCGQVTADEIALGKEIEKLVSSLPGFRGYLAQNQDSPAGVTEHILKALYRSAALVCVMHRRGEVSGRDGRKRHRGSVWIEQEIAIAAFIEQVLNRPTPVRLYCETGVAVEGIRRQIMIHPVSFERAEDILEDLRRWLPRLLAPTGETAHFS